MTKPIKKAQAKRVVRKSASEQDGLVRLIKRLAAEAEQGIPEEKLRRRGRPSIGDDASSSYSVRLPDDLVALVDQRSVLDGITRGETIRRALIAYLTK